MSFNHLSIRLFLAFAIIGIFAVSSADAQGRLSQVRNKVRSPKPAKKPDRDDDDDDDDCRDRERDRRRERERERKRAAAASFTRYYRTDYCPDDDLSGIRAELRELDAGPPTPRIEKPPTYYDFLDYPYQNDAEGFLTLGNDPFQSTGKQWGGRLQGEYRTDFDDLSAISGRFLIDGFGERWGLDAEADYRYEDLGAGRTDDLWTGDVNAVFRLFQSERFQGRLGLGVAWLSDQFGTETGLNFTTGFDMTPAKPWIISLDYDLGSISEARVHHLRFTTGYIYKRVEVYTGYDHYNIGGISLGGMIGGVRLWF